MAMTAGGNGGDAGMQMPSCTDSWISVPASTRRGNLDAEPLESRALGVFDDSAAIEAFGLGMMTFIAPSLWPFHSKTISPRMRRSNRNA